MLTDIEKNNMMHTLMIWGKSKSLGFIELHPLIALILNNEIKDERDLKVIFDSMTNHIK